jgi:flagellar basal-body rod modification protein FlgD
MSQIPSVGGVPIGTASQRDATDSMNDLNTDDFLKLMLTELQNQDPLNPLDNAQMLQQISQIREVGATDRLTDTLDTLLLRQNVATATSLIGQSVNGQGSDGSQAHGRVERVTIVDGKPELHVDGTTAAETVTDAGGMEAGTYSYRIVFEGLDAHGAKTTFAVDVSPIDTTGTPQQDQATLLSNLPRTDSFKSIYRTDASGTGEYYYVDRVAADASRYTDRRADAELSGQILTDKVTPHAGGRSYTVALENVTDIQRATETD